MFFRGLALSSWAAINAYALPTRLVVVAVLCLAGLPVLGQEWEEPTEENFKLTASDGAVDDRFGRSVSISGERVVVGAPIDDDDGSQSGSAYVFRFDSDSKEWVEEEKLTASDGAEDDFFGWSVSIFGERLVVGAHRDEDNGRFSGSAYVFRLDPDSEEWVEEQKLTASDGTEFDRFGDSVSICGERLVVGAHFEGENGFRSGSAYVFRFDFELEEWVEEQKLTASDGAANDRFGRSVSISGERLVVGAHGDDGDEANSGSAYVYRLDPDSKEWLEEQKLTASDGAANDLFGWSVSISGERLVVGAYGDDGDEANSGSAYVYRFDPELEEWVEEEKLTASDGEAGDAFGESVSISGERLVVGARSDDDNGSRSGSAYVFRFDPDCEEWVEEKKLTASDGAAGDLFGMRVCISGERLVVGAPNGSDSGSAYVFDIASDRVKTFLRGDADNNGAVNAFVDGLFLLRFEFQEGDPPQCDDAADANDSGDVSALSDAIFLFRWAFLEGDPPPDPGPSDCGSDPDGVDLCCEIPSDECA